MRTRLVLGAGLLLAMAALARGDGGGDSADYTLVRGDESGSLEGGEWRVVAMTLRGKESPRATLERRDRRLAFRGTTITQTTAAPKQSSRETTFKLIPNTYPREIDWALS